MNISATPFFGLGLGNDRADNINRFKPLCGALQACIPVPTAERGNPGGFVLSYIDGKCTETSCGGCPYGKFVSSKTCKLCSKGKFSNQPNTATCTNCDHILTSLFFLSKCKMWQKYI